MEYMVSDVFFKICYFYKVCSFKYSFAILKGKFALLRLKSFLIQGQKWEARASL